ncbi:MAG: ATP-dependent Clp protease adaptor ClpS [Fimbriimonadaceae bacterium]|nr:ATP-dependent Clp protease adaptor ClpS [Chthonomonadaceae bacterium]MCO5295962.1 ATP-dependent Clp protease adaptor ClpS [Fimbriimonadaceae bacterium]
MDRLNLFAMAGAGVIEKPEVQPTDGDTKGEGWLVTVYNNDVNTYEEVMVILMVATHCSADEAYMEAWEIDHLGASVVHQADEDECRTVAEVIATIGIRVEVSQQP